jgi:HK97 family phage portal protein
MQKTLIPTGRSSKALNGFNIPIQQSYNLINNGLVVYADDKQSYIRNAFLINSTVYSIVSQISKKFASIPLIVYEVKRGDQAKKDFERYKCLRKDFDPQNLLALKMLQIKSMDEVEGTPINNILDNPAKNLSGSDLREQIMGFRLITGAGSLRAIRKGDNNDGEPLELEILPTQHLAIVGDGTLNGIREFQLTMNTSLQPEKYPFKDVMYWKYWNPDYDISGSHLYGLSPIKAGLKDIQTNNTGKTAAAAMMHNGGVRGILTPSPHRNGNEADFTTEQAKELTDIVNGKMNGVENKGKVTTAAVSLQWQEMGMSSVDMNLIETNKLSKDDICNIFNFPAVLISNSNTTYNNVREAKKELVSGLIVNECTSFTDALNRWLVPMFGIKNKQYHIDFDISALPEMQEDMQKMAEALDKMPYLTWNEKRSVQKWDASKDPNLDKFYVDGNLVPLDQLNMPMGDPLNIDALDKAGMNDYKR